MKVERHAEPVDGRSQYMRYDGHSDVSAEVADEPGAGNRP
jgi:hypothetical protein